MSDMYLELKSRIPVVAARTHVGSARLQEAQDAAGLSNERLAREIPVSEKTWRRWKDSGEIPTYALPAVARVLGLELRGAPQHPIDMSTAPASPDTAEVLDRIAQLEETVESLRQTVLASLGLPAERQAGS